MGVAKGRRGATVALLRSVLHNLVVVAVGLGVAYIGTRFDLLLGVQPWIFPFETALGWLLLLLGFLLRVWAAFHFYIHEMRVISLEPQSHLLTSGPYRFTRNPLYLGGNVFIFLGAALLLRSPAAVAITLLHLPFVDLFIRREERQLERSFGDEWREYRSRVRRWL